jgi:uncharacterized protein (DUF302 family)
MLRESKFLSFAGYIYSKMENQTLIRHHVIRVNADFENFTYNMEKILGLLSPQILSSLHEDAVSVVGFLENLGGDNELVLFNIIEHGELLRLKGKSAKAKQYQLGNPIIALKMTQQDIRAGLYAPLRILVYESDAQVYVEYDLPSSQLGQLNDDLITTVAKTLDEKLSDLIRRSDFVS